MTTDRPETRRAQHRPMDIPTPRSGVPTAGFGISAISAASASAASGTPADHHEGRSRAVTIVAALLAVVAVVAAVVVFRIMVPATPTAAAQSADMRAAEAQAEREQPGTIVTWGVPHKYGDGLEIAVNPPERYEPSKNATGVDQGTPMRMQVIVTNRTEAAFRPNTLQMSATSAGQPGIAVWDPDQGIALTGPDVSIPPGTSVHFHLAFAVADHTDVQVEVTPALFGYGATVVRAS